MATAVYRVLPLLAVPLAALATGPAQTATIDDFFDGSHLQEIRLEIDPADWRLLRENYRLDTWYRCTMEWRGFVVKDAAIRSRGSGSRNPIKPGLGIDFSKFVSSQRFLGMKSVVLRNFVQDPSMLHEPLAMGMFRRMGLPYLREAHAKLLINGEYFGLFLLVEPIDTRYLMSHFGESNGYLFEYNWLGDGYHWEYLGDDPANYVPDRFEPKNHESDPQPEWLVALMKAINLSSDAEFPTEVQRYLDIDTFLAHAAVEQFMAEWDGLIGETGTTNFYLYRRSEDDRGVLLVWDKEATFTQPDWSVWRNTQRNAVLKRALDVPAFRRHYLESIAEAARVAGGSGGWLDTEAQRLTAQIRTAAIEDPNRACESDGGFIPCSQSRLEAGWRWVREFALARRAFVENELASAGYSWPAQALEPGCAANAATPVGRLAPGQLVRVDLPRLNRPAVSAAGFPLPVELASVRVRLGSIDVPLIHVDASGIVMQVPFEVPSGPVPVHVIESGIPTNTITVENRPSNPGIFTIVHAGGSRVDAQTPATRGEWIVIYGTGFGRPAGSLASGEASPGDPLVVLKNTVRASIGGQIAPIIWAGFTPGFAGLQQIVVEVPAGVDGPALVEVTMHEETGVPYEIVVR